MPSEHELGALLRGAASRLEAGVPPFATAADAAGLLDVAYAGVESPLGRLLLAATPAGVVRVAFAREDEGAVLEELAQRISPRLLEAPARLDAARRQLDEYFGGGRTTFDLPLDWRLSKGFRARVLHAIAAIPYGRTGTYRSVAMAAGTPNAVRAAGSACATNPIPIIVPCHRVVRSDGSMGRYGGGEAAKRTLLEHEHALP
ncbi:MAG: methylated-DNA-[protein]-cysteine S-methyltransferase [Solirubrobacteraceae bacterium]|nr:methylated-DNA-[protein]-cysteine S-methyltransferase [Solirubrobacteraceae bacterium]